jgi:hypothetical protein
MADVATDFRPIETDVTFTDPVTRETLHYIPWIRYNDDTAAVDVANDLGTGETLVVAATHLWLLKSTTETDDTAKDDLLVGAATISGTVVLQRMTGLVYPRWYRLYVGIGAAGNLRYVTAPIRVVG